MEYERVSRQVLEDGTYRDPYHVEPIELTKKRQRKLFFHLPRILIFPLKTDIITEKKYINTILLIEVQYV